MFVVGLIYGLLPFIVIFGCFFFALGNLAVYPVSFHSVDWSLSARQC